VAKGKKQEDPNKVAQRKAERVAFVKDNPNLAPEVARQRFYVQTRANELEAAGKDVDRAALRAKFQTGGVTREGFYTPGDISRFSASRNTDSLGDSKNTPSVTSTPPVAPVVPSATNVPTPVKPKADTTTSGVKTPPSSYQAPQVTTSLGRVVQPSTSYMGPQTKTPTPVRGGEPGRTAGPSTRGTPVRGGEPRNPVFNQSGLTYTPPTTNPSEGREFSAVVGRINPQAPANPKALREQAQARWEREEVPKIQREMNMNVPLRAAEQSKIDAGYVPAPYDWTNLYKTVAGTAVVAAEIFGTRGGGPVGGALATGAAFNLTERLGDKLESSGRLGGMPGDPGRFEGKTDLKSAAIVSGAALAGNVIGTAAQKIVPKIKPAWQALQKWADDTPVQPMTPWKEGGASSPGIATGITPRTPWREGPISSGSKSPRRVNTPKPAAETPAPTKVDLPGETVTPSGLVVVKGGQRRSTAQIVRDIESRTPEEAAAVGQRALDDVLGRRPTQEPVSLADSKADTVAKQLEQDGVAELTPRQIAARKAAATRKANKEKALEIKSAEPTPAPTKGLTVVEGNPRADAMRNHPAFRGAMPEEPPSLSVVKSDLLEYSTEPPTYPRGTENARLLNEQANLTKNVEPEMDVMSVSPRTWDEDRVLDLGEGSIDNPIETKLVGEGNLPVKATTKNPPRQRANETAEAYGKRLKRWQVENSGEVFKAPAGFDQPRGTTSFREGAMERIEGGMSRTRRSVAFIDDGSGMSPEGFPIQKEGESVRDFNLRASEFLRARGKPTPEAPDNSFLAQGTPEPVSLAGSKEAAAAGSTPPKPKGLGRNAFFDAEKGEWVAGVLDKKSGKVVAKGNRTVYATEEERIAGKKAYEQARNEKRKAARAAASAEVKQKVATASTPMDPNAEYGPFMFAGEPLGRSRVMLEPGQVPDWAQQNVSLSGEAKPLSEIENAWLNKEMTPEENAFFRELGNAKKSSAGKRVVRSTRQPTPEEVREYVAKFRGLRGETGKAQGPTNVAIDDAQQRLEKEIEQVLGTDAMIALKNTAIRGNTPPLTQNIDAGLESLAQVKATARTTGPLINYLDPAKPLPAATGRLREQASQFFNAEGKLKGMTGAGRVRSWQRLTQSDWFRELSRNEPSFANFLIEQNRELGEAFSEGVSQQVGQLAKPGLRRAKPMRAMGAEEEERFIAGQLAAEQTDDGLGSYSLRFGDTPEEGLRARDSGLTVSQRSEAASIEGSLEFRAGATRRVVAEDTEAFGYVSRGRIEGFSDPATEKAQDILRNYGVLDPNGILTLEDAQFAVARRELDSPYVSIADSRTDEVGVAIEEKRKEVVARWRANEITKEQMNAEMLEFRTQLYDAPSTGLPANPFAQDFGTELPTGYVRETPESFGKVWDPDTFTDELGNRVSGKWVTRQEAAEKAQSRINKQSTRTAKMDLERENFYSTRWLDVAKRRAIAGRSTKPDPTPMFDKFGPVRSEASIREEAQRLASLERKAEKARAAAPRGKTAEEIRFELKNPVFGPEAPAGSRSSWGSDAASLREDEARSAREMMEEGFDQFEMDLGDIFGRGDD
jgi:hypothetical protein